MKNNLSCSAALAALATCSCLSPTATASLQAAVDHGIEPNDCRQARGTWAQVKERSFAADDFYLEQDTKRPRPRPELR